MGVFVVFSFVFSVVAGGFTTVVLFSVFLSAGGVVTVSVFCSHAARSAAPAKMQNSFFIVVIGCPYRTKAESAQTASPALLKCNFPGAAVDAPSNTAARNSIRGLPRQLGRSWLPVSDKG